MCNQHQVVECSCYVPMADGNLLQVTAVARQLEGRGRDLASLKCSTGSRAFKRQVKDVVETARLTEFSATKHWRVELYFEPESSADDRSWELAAVVADRMSRGVIPPIEGRAFALGCSESWESGQVVKIPGTRHTVLLNGLRSQLKQGDRVYLAQSDDSLAELEERDLQQAKADVSLISHLGGLMGQPDPSKMVRFSRVWFPLVSGNRLLDRLAWVEVAVVPHKLETDAQPVIHCIGDFSKTQSAEIIEVIEQSRGIDPNGNRQWQTVVRFSQTNYSDNSYELALVMADRIARGREVPARARLIATGCSTRWLTGRVDRVGGCEEKSQLFVKEAVAGDRVLVPQEWQSEMDTQVIDKLGDKGCSLAFIETVAW